MRHSGYAVAACAIGLSGTAFADIAWVNPSGGYFQVGPNWDGGVIPGASDTALFDLSATGYTTGFAGDVQTSRLLIGDDVVAFDLDDHTYTLASTGDSSLMLGLEPGDTADLSLFNGALNARAIVLGGPADTMGSLAVVGSSASLDAGFPSSVGGAGQGQLLVVQGAFAQGSAPLSVGELVTGTGYVTVTGFGSTLTTLSDLFIGDGGLGDLHVSSGGAVQADGGMVFGNQSDGFGQGSVVGAGSTITAASMTVGETGIGDLVATLGGAAEVEGPMLVGAASDGAGSATAYHGGAIAAESIRVGVLGSGSLYAIGSGASVSATDFIEIGGGGEGLAIVSDGASMHSDADSVIGATHAHEAIAIVTGEGSNWHAGDLAIGSKGLGGMLVEQAGFVSTDNSIVIGAIDGRGSMTVQGTGSIAEAGGGLEISSAAEGLLTVSDAGSARANGPSVIASGGGAMATVLVSGTGSTIDFQDTLDISTAATASAQIAVEDQGSLSVRSLFVLAEEGSASLATTGGSIFAAEQTTVASKPGAEAAIDVGAGGEVTFGSLLTLGSRGQAQVTACDGGQVICDDDAVIADDADASAVITLAGAGTTWLTERILTLGKEGQAQVTISEGAVLDTLIRTDVGTGADSEVDVTVGTGGVWRSASTIFAQGPGRTAVHLDDGTIEGPGIVLGANDSLDGNGTIVGVLANQGTVSPGQSVGVLELGNFQQAPTGLLYIEVAGTDPETGYDRLEIDGFAFLGGTLWIQPLPGYEPSIGDTFEIMHVGGSPFTGTFDVDGPGEVWVNYTTDSVLVTYVTLPMFGDLNDDGSVGVADLLLLLTAWGDCPTVIPPCRADLNGDGSIDVHDLLLLIAAWD